MLHIPSSTKTQFHFRHLISLHFIWIFTWRKRRRVHPWMREKHIQQKERIFTIRQVANCFCRWSTWECKGFKGKILGILKDMFWRGVYSVFLEFPAWISYFFKCLKMEGTMVKAYGKMETRMRHVELVFWASFGSKGRFSSFFLMNLYLYILWIE